MPKQADDEVKKEYLQSEYKRTDKGKTYEPKNIKDAAYMMLAHSEMLMDDLSPKFIKMIQKNPKSLVKALDKLDPEGKGVATLKANISYIIDGSDKDRLPKLYHNLSQLQNPTILNFTNQFINIAQKTDGNVATQNEQYVEGMNPSPKKKFKVTDPFIEEVVTYGLQREKEAKAEKAISKAKGFGGMLRGFASKFKSSSNISANKGRGELKI